MSTSHGSRADVVGNGYVLSKFLNSATFNGTRDSSESTTFKATSKMFVQGLQNTSMQLQGIFEGQTGLVDDILFAAMGAGEGVYSYIPQGYEVVGNVGYSISAFDVSYGINTAVGNVAQISADLSPGIGGIDLERGLVSHPLAAEAAAGNGVSIDNGAVPATTTNGISLIAHVTAAAAGISIFLQDSADNVTFADLAGSIAVPIGTSSQRLSIAGTVRRYTRVRWTGAATFLTITNRK